MDPVTIRVMAGVAAVLVLMVIVYRRKKSAEE
jgi:hypothetical protein